MYDIELQRVGVSFDSSMVRKLPFSKTSKTSPMGMFADNAFNKNRRKVGKLPNQKVKFKKSSTISKKARIGLNSDLTLYTNSVD